MRYSERPYSHFCSGEFLQAAFPSRGGHDLHAWKTVNPKPKAEHYEIVSDGTKFGIYFRGEVVLHGMELERARSTANILNEVLVFRKVS